MKIKKMKGFERKKRQRLPKSKAKKAMEKNGEIGEIKWRRMEGMSQKTTWCGDREMGEIRSLFYLLSPFSFLLGWAQSAAEPANWRLRLSPAVK